MKPVRAAKPTAAGQLGRPSLGAARGAGKFADAGADEDNFVVSMAPARMPSERQQGGIGAHRDAEGAGDAGQMRRASASGRSPSPQPRIADALEIFEPRARRPLPGAGSAGPGSSALPAAMTLALAPSIIPNVTLGGLDDTTPARSPLAREEQLVLMLRQQAAADVDGRVPGPIMTGAKGGLDGPQSMAALHNRLAAVVSGADSRPLGSPQAQAQAQAQAQGRLARKSSAGHGLDMAAIQAEAAAASAALLAGGGIESRSPHKFGNGGSPPPVATGSGGNRTLAGEPVTPPTIHPYVPEHDPNQPPSPPTWRNFLPANLPVEGRELPVHSTVSTSYETWCKGCSNFVVYGVQLRVLNYSADEEQYFPCHASPADLAAHSRFFEQVFMSPASADLINHRYITVDLDIPQEILHMIVEALYLRSIYLTPQNVELILMVAKFMQLECILKAVKKYLLNDLMPCAPAEVCKLVTKKIPDIRHHVIKFAYSADVSEDSFRRLLDQSLTFDEARDILRYKKKCGEFSCEVELLDCVSAMVNKRHQLLPEVVDFAQMHTAEVDSVLRYCMDVLRFEKTDAMPAEILEIHRDFWIHVWSKATEVRLETGKGNPMCPRNLHFWKLPKSELQAQLQREIKVKPFVVDDVTYELELTKRSGDWMVKLVSPNEDVLRSRRLEARCRLISLANKEYSKGDMSPWMIWRTDWLWHSTADKADRGSDILAEWLREAALEFESGAERWLFVGVQVVHDRVRQQ